MPVVSEDAAKSDVKTEAQLAQERQQACYVAIESQILRHINPEVSQASRFSRVIRPMPTEYYAHKIASENTGRVIEFQIVHINRMIVPPTQAVEATGTFDSDNGELLLKDERGEKFVPASEHPLLKKKPNT
jgi:hypothetical protein